MSVLLGVQEIYILLHMLLGSKKPTATLRQLAGRRWVTRPRLLDYGEFVYLCHSGFSARFTSMWILCRFV